MDTFMLDDLIGRLDTSGPDSAAFFSADTLSLTIAFRPADSVDPQQPHTEDEVYFVASGRGRIKVADEDIEVAPGSIIFVAAGVEHRFHSIEEDLKLLVFWSPPRGTNAVAGAT